MTEPVIVGGGPAGTAVACTLAAAGRRPLLIERDAAPYHKICGEFLSWEAQAMLCRLDIDLDALGASRIGRLRLAHGRVLAETPLPFTARGLTRRTLDTALLARAEALGAHVRRGVAVRAITVDGPMLTVEADAPVRAATLFLASGKRDVRGQQRDIDGTIDDLVGFKTYVRLSAAQARALDGHVELVLFDGGYAGLQMVEDGMANLCLLMTRDRLARTGGRWAETRATLADDAPHLALRLDGATELLDRPLTIAGLPYGFVHRPGADDPAGLFRVGDQFAVIPSFTGDGMSIALASGAAAAHAWLRGETAGMHHTAMAQILRRQVAVAELLYRVAASRAGQMAMLHAARVWPGLIRLAARATRVPRPALAHAGLEHFPVR